MKKILMLAGLMVVLTGCGNGLSRGKAKDIIIKQVGYPIQFNYNLRVGQRLLPVSNVAEYSQLNILMGDGLIEIENKGKVNIGQDYALIVTLTNEGKKYVVGTPTTEKGIEVGGIKVSMDNTFATVKVAEKIFVEVTGISMQSDNKEATVNYTWKYSNPTPFGKGMEDAKPRNETVTLVLYDDGWRLKP